MKSLVTGIKSKKFLVFAVVLFTCMTATFAAGQTIAVMDTFGQKLLDLTGSKWLKAILAVMLMITIGVAAYGNANGADQLVKNAIRWAIGTAVILAGTSVVNFFFNSITTESLGYVIDGAKSAVQQFAGIV